MIEKQFEELGKFLSNPDMYNNIAFLSGVSKDILSNIENFLASIKRNYIKINPFQLKEIEEIYLQDIVLLTDIEYFVRNPDEEKFLISLIERCKYERKILILTGEFSVKEIRFSEKILSYLKNAFNIGFKIERKAENHFKEIIKTIEQDLPEVKPESSIVEELREEYKAKMYIWKMKGFNTARIERVIDGNIDEITSEFVSFTSDIQRLIELQKRYGILELHMIPEKEKIEIEKKLFDPDSVAELDYKISFYEKRSNLRNHFKFLISWGEDVKNIGIDETNKEIIDFINDFCMEPYKYKGLNLIRGDRGFGKTTYLNLAGVQLFERFKSLVIAFITPHSILNIEEFIDDISYWDLALFDDIDKILFRYQKYFNDDILNIIFGMPVIATFTSKGFIETMMNFEKRTIIEIKEPGKEIKKKMLEKIAPFKRIEEEFLSKLDKIKGGYYEIENFVEDYYYERKKTGEIKEEKEIKPEMEEKQIEPEIEVKEIEPQREVKEEVKITEEKIEEKTIQEEKKEEEKVMKKISYLEDGIVLDIEDNNLRMQKVL
uniref:Chromosomal replication initiator protein DnaA domain-containing protein n=1 Tax=candidate division WOR-3 bacterium TaxID=2052148 RepID=A0A7C4U7H7_UNCW3